ncbi:site-specific recombinase XerD [Sphingobacterium alimentarium]|uniref:Site-specific recombinase XerD n=2 Tax=Sphingobacterium alimentarium TaxID=797292 RepID=A0A4R3VZM1_9SPHI|nr:site-specific recombinase XerD [Sphingobacterium alimentarium]
MSQNKQTIDDLMSDFFDHMRSIHRTEGSLKRYKRKWQRIKNFMSAQKLKYYSESVQQAYLKHELGDYHYYQLDRQKRDLVNITEALGEFQKTGRLFMGPRKQRPKEFCGSAAASIKSFIEYRQGVLNLSDNTIKSYVFHLYSFCCYIHKYNINLEAIKASEVLLYVEDMNPDKPANRHVSLKILRNYFKYLYENKTLSTDYSRIIPKDNYKNQPKLPSTFTDVEITQLLKSVDRGNPKGKRDYAMLLLAIRLGLRASDICELTFDNVIWERNIIQLVQFKTGKAIELPLLPEVGNAMIAYLKYGRPVTDDNHFFIHALAPYERIHSSDMGNMVRKYMTLSKINYSNRKHGPHSLRHSFASALLRDKVPLPVISEALGHSSMDSTMLYLRIDKDSLKKCALEVPALKASFYEQKIS